MREPRDERRLVAGLLAAGLLLRLALAVAAMGGPYDPYARLEGDSADYLSLGISLSRGEGYSFHYRPWLRETLQGLPATLGPLVPTALRSPGYPVFLAAVFALAGLRLHLVILLQVALSALVPLLVYLTARELKAPAVAALAFAVFYVPFWFDAAYVMSETLLTFCTTLALWLLVRPGRGAAAGIAAGFAILVKSVAAPFFVLAALRLDRRRAVGYLAALACVVAPWTVRNFWRAGGGPGVAPALGGYQAFILHNPLNRDLAVFSRPGDQNEDYPGFQDEVRRVHDRAPRAADSVAQEYLEDRALLAEAIRFAFSDPGQALRASAASVLNMWRFDIPIGHWRSGYALPAAARWSSALALCAGLMPFAILGVVRALRGGSDAARVIALFLLAFLLIHAPLSATVRHRASAMPAFFVMAAYGLSAFAARRRGPRSSPS